MQRRYFLAAAATAALATLVPVDCAQAAGVIAAPGVETTEARIAIAVSAQRTTTWSSVRLDGKPGAVAMVVPTLDGSSLDYSSRAFFEALEDATAPRVLPPNEAPAACPGQTPGAAFSIEGDQKGEPALEPLEVATLATSADVEAWASAHGLAVDPVFAAGLASFGASYRFVVVFFQTPGGPAITKTLRAVSPSPDPTLPLVLSLASASDLRITTWQLGAGRSNLGGTEVALANDNLAFKVTDETSNYVSLRDAILSDPSRHIVEAAGHGPLVASTSLFDGSASIDSVIDSYYTRAFAYGDATSDSTGCTFHAATMLSQGAPIGHACPRAVLGYAGAAGSCAESTPPLGLDPAQLRCGGDADDLAVGLSDLVANSAWVTRTVLRLPPTKAIANVNVGFAPAPPVSMVRDATSIDQTGCGKSTSSGTPSTGSGTPPSSGSGTPGGGQHMRIPVYRHEGCSGGGSYSFVGYDDYYAPDGTTDSPPSAYYDNTGDSCASSSTDSSTSSDSCASDPSASGSSDVTACDSSGTSDSSSGACDSGSSGSSDSCGSGSSGSSDGCSGSGSGDSCSGGGSGDNSCTIAPHRRPHRYHLHLSAGVYALALVLTPIRRWRRRRAGRSKSRR